MPFLKIEDLKTLIIDFTSHCNAMCGNCSRNISGVELNPNMPLQHMSLDTWKKIIDTSSLVTKNIPRKPSANQLSVEVENRSLVLMVTNEFAKRIRPN